MYSNINDDRGDRRPVAWMDRPRFGGRFWTFCGRSFEDYVAQFVANAATQTIAFVGTGSINADHTVLIDNVRITSAP